MMMMRRRRRGMVLTASSRTSYPHWVFRTSSWKEQRITRSFQIRTMACLTDRKPQSPQIFFFSSNSTSWSVLLFLKNTSYTTTVKQLHKSNEERALHHNVYPFRATFNEVCKVRREPVCVYLSTCLLHLCVGVYTQIPITNCK